MVLGHPSRSALFTPPITSSRISSQPTTRHRLRRERGGRGTTTSRTTTRAANERSPPKSACAGDAVLRTRTLISQCPYIVTNISRLILRHLHSPQYSYNYDYDLFIHGNVSIRKQNKYTTPSFIHESCPACIVGASGGTLMTSAFQVACFHPHVCRGLRMITGTVSNFRRKINTRTPRTDLEMGGAHSKSKNNATRSGR